jgi:hypothetical protein
MKHSRELGHSFLCNADGRFSGSLERHTLSFMDRRLYHVTVQMQPMVIRISMVVLLKFFVAMAIQKAVPIFVFGIWSTMDWEVLV